MAIWSKGVDRSLTDEKRKEDIITPESLADYVSEMSEKLGVDLSNVMDVLSEDNMSSTPSLTTKVDSDEYSDEILKDMVGKLFGKTLISEYDTLKEISDWIKGN